LKAAARTMRDAEGSVIRLTGVSSTSLNASGLKRRCRGGGPAAAIFNSANLDHRCDAKGVIQIFNVGAERMLLCRRRNDEQVTPPISPILRN